MRTSEPAVPRTEPRIRVGLPLRLRFGWADCEEAKVSTVDMSERGLRVHWHAPLRLGMNVTAIFESKPDDVRLYRVLWVHETKSPTPGFDIGLEIRL
jgi:hypothetical protein